MSDHAVGFVAALPLVIAAFQFGLYFGERGRRKAAERWAVRGSPDDAMPAAVSRVPMDAETRLQLASHASEEAIESGVDALRQQYRERGWPIDEGKLRRDVEAMLSGQDVLE